MSALLAAINIRQRMRQHSMPIVSDFDGRRDNNFTLLRLIFASAVLFGHGFYLTKTDPDPISSAIGVWIGSIAVDGFFAISGFLVAGSFARQGVVNFALLRAVRVYPALIVCVAISIIVGATITTLPIATYFASPITWDYAKNIFLYNMYWVLPGVFETNSYSPIVNGSLWTLPVEVMCYFLLMCAGFLGALGTRLRINAAALAALVLVNYSSIPVIEFVRPASFFALGVLVWANRHFIPLHSGIALLSCLLLVISVQVPTLSLFPIALVYLIFYAAFAARHVDVDRFGDISYGVYIYAWPVQQLVWSDLRP